jgi:hypothetical protein
MIDRIAIAKTEITMLWEVRVDQLWWKQSRKEAGQTNHDHACITPTTGFILADIERRAEDYNQQKRDES